ncbi:MAG: hypothetical protein NZ811_02055 [Gammaproteobacteria bacterium]|nr:hypothetical protein [Gammaproteobacteria bacterium]
MPDQIKILNPNGINKDISPYELPADKWSDGNNIQFDNDKTKKIKGHSQALGSLSVSPYWLMPFTTTTDAFWIYPSLTKIYKTNGTTDTNITRQTAGSDVDYSATAAGGWNGGVLGGVAILNNGIDVPQQFGSASTYCANLDNWDSTWKTSVIRPFKQFLVALNIQEGSNKYPYRVRWSHPAEGGTVPVTWDSSDATKDAGYVDLAQTNGWVVDCLPLKDTNIIYKEDSVWGMSFEGGQSIFRFFEIFNDTGILGKRCVKAFDDKHFVVTSNDVYVHNTQAKESIIDKQMRDELFNSIHSDYYDRTFVAPNYEHNEMWICFVSGSNTTDAFADKAFVWNWRNNTWSKRDLPHVSHIGWGIIDAASSVTNWSESGTWDTDTNTWDFRGYNPSLTSMLMAAPNTTIPASSKLFETDKTNQFNATSYTSWVEKTGMPLDYSGVKSVKKIIPKVSGTGAVNFYVGTEMKANEGVAWKGPYAFTPGAHSEIPVRATGSFISVKAESVDDKTWELDNLEVHWSPSGVRGSGV